MLLRRCIALAFVLTQACRFDAQFEPSVEVRCESSADCPTGLQCVRTLGRCLAIGGDQPLPLHVSVTPSIARADTRVTWRLTSTVALMTAPVIRIVPGAAASLTPALEAQSADGIEWSLTMVVGSDAPEGQHTVVADLISHAGAVSSNVALGIITFDLTPPTLAPGASLTLVPRIGGRVREITSLGVGARARLSFAASEALLEPPEVFCGSTPEEVTLRFTALGPESTPCAAAVTWVTVSLTGREAARSWR